VFEFLPFLCYKLKESKKNRESGYENKDSKGIPDIFAYRHLLLEIRFLERAFL
jgi:hypothetical protein